MKISNVSKKVLCSALSAAMVVAFAPTVALGSVATNDAVTIQFDTTGLTVKNMNTEYAESYTAYASADNVIALSSTALSGHEYVYAGTNAGPAGWYMDVDGVEGKGNKDIALGGNGVLDLRNSADAIAAVSAGSSIVLKPYAGEEAVEVGDAVFNDAESGTAVPQTVTNNGTLTFDLDASAGYTNLRASLTKDGTEIGFALTAYTAAVGEGSADDGSVEFTFVSNDSAAVGTAGYIKKGSYGAGKYVLTVTDQVTGKVVATKSFEIVEVALEGIFTVNEATVVGNKFLALKDDKLVDALTDAEKNDVDVTAVSDTTESPKDVTYYTVDGKAVIKNTSGTLTDVESEDAKKTKVKAGMVLTPVYDAAVLSAVEFTGTAIEATVINAQATGNTAKYTIEVSGAATAAADYEQSDLSGSVAVYAFGTAGAVAGTYTVTVKYTTGIGSNVEKTTVVGTKDVTLTTITLDLGEYGTLKAGNATAIAASTDKLVDYVPEAASIDVKNPYRFVGWSLDGTNVITSNDKVGSSAVTLKAVYAQDRVDAPTFSYADGKLSLATDAGAGYDIYYSTTTPTDNYTLAAGAVKYTGALTADPTETESYTIYAQVVKGANATGKLSSKVVTITSYKAGNTDTAVEDWAKGAVAQKTGSSTAAAPQYYSELLKDAVSSAKKAVTDTAYSDNWNKVAAAAEAEVLKAIAEVEYAALDAAVAGVAQADGSVKKLDSAVADAAKAKIANVLTDFAYNTDGKDATVATDVKTPTTSETVNDYATKIAGYSKAALDSAVTYKAEDVAAAAAVTEQLQSTDAATAEAGLAAYATLTDTQKQLVSAADIAAAQAVVAKAAEEKAAEDAEKAAQALIDAQDGGTLNKIKATKTKTYTLKSKKKTTSAHSISYTTTLSKSGNAVTYAKVSGSAKITVTEAGKVKLKKGAVKGKTYTATVLAACGTQTRTVKVKFSIQ